MDILTSIVACAAAGLLSYMAGRWHGYIDALPKRDDKGRFAKED